MNPTPTLLVLALAPLTLAQDVPQSPRPPLTAPDVKSMPAVATIAHQPMRSDPAIAPSGNPVMRTKAATPSTPDAITAMLNDPQQLWVDAAADDGALWVLAHGFKAGFTPADWTLVPRPRHAAERPLELRFSLAEVTVGGERLPCADRVPERTARRITWDRGAVVEIVDLGQRSVEQSFRFDTLPTRGALRLVLDVQGEVLGHDRGDGIEFVRGDQSVAYGEAIAIDAKGERVPAPTTFADGRIVIDVPTAFVQRAALPLLIDPQVSWNFLESGTRMLHSPDIAWDETSQTWLVCAQFDYSATDTDVYGWRLDPTMQPIGGLLLLDVTTSSWERPRLANHDADNSFLMVAQVSTDSSSPYWIAGRRVWPNGTLDPQITIEKDGLPGHVFGDKLRPQIGGAIDPSGPSYYTVVWERVWNATDHDIHMKQCLPSGAPRSAAPTLIENSSAMTRSVAISKSNGPPPASAQHWAVAFARTMNPGNDDVWGAFVTWDGQLVVNQGASLFVVDDDPNHASDPAVSSPTHDAGTRKFLFAWSSITTGNGDIVGAVIDQTATELGRGNITAMTAAPGESAWPQTRPDVDCDGVRFLVAYNQLYQGTGTDEDAYLTLVAWDGSAFEAHDEAHHVVASQYVTGRPQVASRYSGRGSHSLRYGITADEAQPTRGIVYAHAWDGYGSGWNIRPILAGCGSLQTFVSGRAVIGESFALTLSFTSGLMGFVAGAGLPPTPVPGCPNCTYAVVGDTFLGPVLNVTVPLDPALVGGGPTVQGFAFTPGLGVCLGDITLGRAYELTVR